MSSLPIETIRARPKQARSAATFDRILAAANEVFGRVGVDSATTTQIAEQAGVSVGSVYRFFSSKEAIALTLAEQGMEMMQWLYDDLSPRIRSLSDVGPVVGSAARTVAEVIQSWPGIGAVFIHPTITDPACPIAVRRSELLEALVSLGARFGLHEPRDEIRQVVNLFMDTAVHMGRLVPVEEPDRSLYLDELARQSELYVTGRLAEIAGRNRLALG